MASAKKAKKSRKVAPKRYVGGKAPLPSRKQRSLENSQTPEEMIAKIDAANLEHNQEVEVLVKRIARLINKANFHPTVALDSLQVLMSLGIGNVLGVAQKDLYDAHVKRYHEESRVLSVAEALGFSLSDLYAMQAEPETPGDPEATELGGPNDYAKGM